MVRYVLLFMRAEIHGRGLNEGLRAAAARPSARST